MWDKSKNNLNLLRALIFIGSLGSKTHTAGQTSGFQNVNRPHQCQRHHAHSGVLVFNSLRPTDAYVGLYQHRSGSGLSPVWQQSIF